MEQHRRTDAVLTGASADASGQGRIEFDCMLVDAVAGALDIEHAKWCSGFVDAGELRAEIGFVRRQGRRLGLRDEAAVRQRRRQSKRIAFDDAAYFLRDQGQADVVGHEVMEM